MLPDAWIGAAPMAQSKARPRGAFPPLFLVLILGGAQKDGRCLCSVGIGGNDSASPLIPSVQGLSRDGSSRIPYPKGHRVLLWD